MLTPSRTSFGQQEEALPTEIQELTRQIEQLPHPYRQNLQPSLLRVVEMTQRRRRILTLVQEAIGQLRLDMKYLIFDLDATRRERDHFRNNLEGDN